MVTSKKLIVFSTLVLMLSGCYKVEHPDTEPIAFKQPEIQFQKSGTILLSRAMPQKVARASVPGTHRMMMPLIGYIPPSVGFLPADNETWLEIDSLSKKLTLFRGKKVLAVVQAEGMIGAEPGLYALQHKEKDPLWYAPDKYFSKRKLGVPTEDAQTRYLRGALGSYALFPTDSFAVHSGVVWSEEVGGLRVSRAELSKLYYMLPLGSSIVIK